MGTELMPVQNAIRLLIKNNFRNQSEAALAIADYMHGGEVDPRSVDHGGFSLKMRGARSWTIDDVVALQSITGTSRITDAMARAGRQDDETGQDDDVSALHRAASIIREAGEAATALTDGSNSDDVERELIDVLEAVTGALTAVRRRANVQHIGRKAS